MFLVDAPPREAAAVSAALTRGLRGRGLELTTAADRLNAFNAVQNTYLDTFQVLGGLGLLLGSAGLGVVVLRNVLERRGELALLAAVGFTPRALRRLVVAEHALLQTLGLMIGVAAAVLALLPVLLSPSAQISFVSLGTMLGLVFVSGIFLDLGGGASGLARRIVAGAAKRIELGVTMKRHGLPFAWTTLFFLLLTFRAPADGTILYHNNFERADTGQGAR